MPRKKKETTPEPQIEEIKVETKPTHLEQWFIERIGNDLNVKLGKDLTYNSTLYCVSYGPYADQEQCLLALENIKKLIEKQVKKAKAIAAAEPEPEPFTKTPKKTQTTVQSTEKAL